MMWKLCAIGLVAAGLAAAAQIPSGTQIQIRLKTALKTSSAKTDDPVEAVAIAPVVAGDEIVMAAGATLSGHIKEVKAAVQPDDQAVLDLVFDQVSDASGAKAKLAAKVTAVDNARDARPSGTAEPVVRSGIVARVAQARGPSWRLRGRRLDPPLKSQVERRERQKSGGGA